MNNKNLTLKLEMMINENLYKKRLIDENTYLYVNETIYKELGDDTH